jgi:hypothetical protein
VEDANDITETATSLSDDEEKLDFSDDEKESKSSTASSRIESKRTSYVEDNHTSSVGTGERC